MHLKNNKPGPHFLFRHLLHFSALFLSKATLKSCLCSIPLPFSLAALAPLPCCPCQTPRSSPVKSSGSIIFSYLTSQHGPALWTTPPSVLPLASRRPLSSVMFLPFPAVPSPFLLPFHFPRSLNVAPPQGSVLQLLLPSIYTPFLI